MATGMSMSRMAGGFNPLALPQLRFFVHTDDGVPSHVFTGTSGAFSGTAPNMTFTDGAQAWGTFDQTVSQFMTVTGATSPGNNTTVRITNRVSFPDRVTYSNASGVAEAFAGSYATGGKVYSITDRLSGIAFSQAADRSGPAVQLVQKPGHRVWGNTGGSGNAASHIIAADPVASAFNGAPAFTLACYVNVVSYTSAGSGDGDLMALGDANALNTGTAHQIRWTLSNNGFTLFLDASTTTAGNNTIYSGGRPAGWTLFCVTYDGVGGANSVKFYADGTLLGQGSMIHSSPTLTRVLLGRSFALTPGGEWYTAGYAGFTGHLTAAEMQSLSSWFASTLA
jgi:hypothetical protein